MIANHTLATSVDDSTNSLLPSDVSDFGSSVQKELLEIEHSRNNSQHIQKIGGYKSLPQILTTGLYGLSGIDTHPNNNVTFSMQHQSHAITSKKVSTAPPFATSATGSYHVSSPAVVTTAAALAVANGSATADMFTRTRQRLQNAPLSVKLAVAGGAAITAIAGASAAVMAYMRGGTPNDGEQKSVQKDTDNQKNKTVDRNEKQIQGGDMNTSSTDAPNDATSEQEIISAVSNNETSAHNTSADPAWSHLVVSQSAKQTPSLSTPLQDDAEAARIVFALNAIFHSPSSFFEGDQQLEKLGKEIKKNKQEFPLLTTAEKPGALNDQIIAVLNSPLAGHQKFIQGIRKLLKFDSDYPEQNPEPLKKVALAMAESPDWTSFIQIRLSTIWSQSMELASTETFSEKMSTHKKSDIPAWGLSAAITSTTHATPRHNDKNSVSNSSFNASLVHSPDTVMSEPKRSQKMR